MPTPRSDCPLCGAALRETYRVEGHPLGTCAGCGSVTVMERFTDAELAHHYETSAAEDYRMDYGQPQGDGRVWRERLALLTRLSGRRTPGDVLDVGAAYGSFASVTKDAGWRTTTVELTADGRAALGTFLPKDRIFARIEDVPPDARFDLITLFDVVEHLPDPVDTLRRARALLRPDGYLFFTTVSVESLNHRLFGDAWMYFRPPRHLVHFTRTGLDRMLEAAGFARTHFATRFMPHAFWAGVSARVGKLPRASSFAQRVVGFGLRKALGPVGAGDIVDVGARPR